jgi:hypothetical protein
MGEGKALGRFALEISILDDVWRPSLVTFARLNHHKVSVRRAHVQTSD